MSRQGFAKIVNAPFTRFKPNLCPFCVHCLTPGGIARASGYDYVCRAKNTVLSCAQTTKGRCADFEKTEETWVTQQTINEEIEMAEKYQAWRKEGKE